MTLLARRQYRAYGEGEQLSVAEKDKRTIIGGFQ